MAEGERTRVAQQVAAFLAGLYSVETELIGDLLTTAVDLDAFHRQHAAVELAIRDLNEGSSQDWTTASKDKRFTRRTRKAQPSAGQDHPVGPRHSADRR